MGPLGSLGMKKKAVAIAIVVSASCTPCHHASEYAINRLILFRPPLRFDRLQAKQGSHVLIDAKYILVNKAGLSKAPHVIQNGMTERNLSNIGCKGGELEFPLKLQRTAHKNSHGSTALLRTAGKGRAPAGGGCPSRCRGWNGSRRGAQTRAARWRGRKRQRPTAASASGKAVNCDGWRHKDYWKPLSLLLIPRVMCCALHK